MGGPYKRRVKTNMILGSVDAILVAYGIRGM
jgi:hypothetical protein